jgi:hypothetical protein
MLKNLVTSRKVWIGAVGSLLLIGLIKCQGWLGITSEETKLMVDSILIIVETLLVSYTAQNVVGIAVNPTGGDNK